MTDSQAKLDPKMLQVRWVLGGLSSEGLVEQMITALEQGFDGTAIRQLAGLIRPSSSDLGNLPNRAFAEMGLQSMDTEGAAALLFSRSELLTVPVVLTLVQSFPAFSDRWQKHLAEWHGEPAGAYIDMAEFVHFVVEDLYEKGNVEEVTCAFRQLETLFVEGDQDTRNVIGLGVFETLQCFASWRPYGNKVFEPFLGPMSSRVWASLQNQWAGKSSLMDVIRSERDAGES